MSQIAQGACIWPHTTRHAEAPIFLPFYYSQFPSSLYHVKSYMGSSPEEIETEISYFMDIPPCLYFNPPISGLFLFLALLFLFSSSIFVRQKGMWHTGLKLDLLTACFYLLNRTDCLPTMRGTYTRTHSHCISPL